MCLWNINGHLPLKLHRSDVRSAIRRNDITVFFETWLMPHNEASVKIPDNYSAIFKSRPFPGGRPWGSLCAMVRDNLRYLVVEELSRPGLLVLQLPCCYIVAGYVAPASSKACTRAVVHPFQYFSEAVTFLVSNTDLPLAGLTDVNGRIGTRSPVNAPSCCSRLRSIDTKLH